MTNWFDIERDARVRGEENARSLLQSVLPEEKWSGFEKDGTVFLDGKRNSYVLSPGSMTEVRDKTHGRLLAHACVQLSVAAPRYDRLVAEYLLLKNDEDLYWKVANVFPQFDLALRVLVTLDVVLFAFLLVELVCML